MDIIQNIKSVFKQGNIVTRLIFINATVFILLNALIIIFKLFNVSAEFVLSYLAMPASLTKLMFRFWTPLTYMFLHQGFFHVLFNMFALYWFGRLFILFFTEKQLLGLYLLGGFLAAIFYVGSFNLFPYYVVFVPYSILLGASGSIMAIIVASAVHSPNMEMQMVLFGSVKLKYIALMAVAMSFFGITSDNGGGELAHLGGALAGYIFVVSLRQGRDITKGLNGLIDVFYNIYTPGKLKVKKKSTRTSKPMNDGDFNANKARKMKEIDHILDKIKSSGYQSLSTEEKKQLFEQGKRN